MKRFCFLLFIIMISMLCSCKKDPVITSHVLYGPDWSMDATFLFAQTEGSEKVDPWLAYGDSGDLKFNMVYYPWQVQRDLWSSWDFPYVVEYRDSASGVVTLDVPPLQENEYVEIPFSTTIPWTFIVDSVAEGVTTLKEIAFGHHCRLRYWLDEGAPVKCVSSGLSFEIPASCWFEEGALTSVLEQEWLWIYRGKIYVEDGIGNHPHESIVGGHIELPEELWTLDHIPFQWDIPVTVHGTVRIERDHLIEGRDWPTQLNLNCSLEPFEDYGGTTAYASVAKLDFPASFALPDGDVNRGTGYSMSPALKYGNPYLKFSDTRLLLQVQNKTPFTYSFSGIVEGRKEGNTLASYSFGEQYGKDPILIEPYVGDVLPWRFSFSEFDAFPEEWYIPYLIDGFSTLFDTIPDQVLLKDLCLVRDPDAFVCLVKSPGVVAEDASVSYTGRISTPFRAADGFAVSRSKSFDISSLARQMGPVKSLEIEATMVSTLPFNITITGANIDLDYIATIDPQTASIPAGSMESPSSQKIRFVFPSDIGFSGDDIFQVGLRFSTDHQCENRAVNREMSVSLSSIKMTYEK